MLTASFAGRPGVADAWAHQRRGRHQDVPSSAAVLRNGDVVMAGQTAGIAYRLDASTGEVVWSRGFGTAEADAFHAVASFERPDADGGDPEAVVLAGSTRESLVGWNSHKLVQPAAVKVDARTGEELWRLQFPGGSGILLGAAADPEGDIFVVGSAGGGSGSFADPVLPRESDWLAMKVDGATGRVLWRWQDGTSDERDVLLAAAADSEGNLIAAGYGRGSGRSGSDYVVVKLNPDGEVLWRYQVAGAQDGGYRAIVVDAADDVYVGAGEVPPGLDKASAPSAVVGKLDGADGSLLWSSDGRSSEGGVTLSGLGIDDSAGLVLCFGSIGAPASVERKADFALMAFDSETGEKVERRQDGTSEEDFLTFDGVGRDRSIYLRGYTHDAWGAADQAGADMVAMRFPPLHRTALAASASASLTHAPTASPGGGIYSTESSVPLPTTPGASDPDPQGDEGVEASVNGGVDVPEWVVPAAAGAAAAIFAVLLVCLWASIKERRRKRGSESKMKPRSSSVSQELQAVPGPLRPRSSRTVAAMLISSSSPAADPEDVVPVTPTEVKPGVDALGVAESPAVSIIPAAANTGVTATVSASASSCGSPMEKEEAGGGHGLVDEGHEASTVVKVGSVQRHEEESQEGVDVQRGSPSSHEGSPQSGAQSPAEVGGQAIGFVGLPADRGSVPDRRFSAPAASLRAVWSAEPLRKAEETAPAALASGRDAPLPALAQGGREEHEEGMQWSGGSSTSSGEQGRGAAATGGESASGPAAPTSGDRRDEGKSEAGVNDPGDAVSEVDQSLATTTRVRIDASALVGPAQMPALLTPDNDCVLEIVDYVGDESEEGTPAGVARTWEGVGEMRGGLGGGDVEAEDEVDVEMGNSGREPMRSKRHQLHAREDVRRSRGSFMDRYGGSYSGSYDGRHTNADDDFAYDHYADNGSSKNLDEISLASTQMPELLSPLYPGMFPISSTFSASGTDGQESTTHAEALDSRSGVDGLSPLHYVKRQSGTVSPVSGARSPAPSTSSAGSRVHRVRSPLLRAAKDTKVDKGRWTNVAVGVGAGGNDMDVSGSSSKPPRRRDPPPYGKMRSAALGSSTGFKKQPAGAEQSRR